MKTTDDFPFHKSRRLKKTELEAHRKAIEKKTGVKRKVRGRPSKGDHERYIPLSIRLHPEALGWARGKADAAGIGYQSLINLILLELEKHGRIRKTFLEK